MDGDAARKPAERPASDKVRRKPNARSVTESARSQFEEMTGRDVEAVSAIREVDEGWQVDVEVVELLRIPDTTSVLASYAVRVNGRGDITGYERVSRYTRGQTEL